MNYARNSKEAFGAPTGIPAQLRARIRAGVLSIAGMGATPRPGSRFVRGLYGHAVFDEDRPVFNAFVKRLRDFGEFINTAQLLEFAAGKLPIDGRYFHLSFDDGFRSVCSNAAPILTEHGGTATFFVVPGFIGATESAARDYQRIINNKGLVEVGSWDDFKTAADAGFEIGSHTFGHARLSRVSAEPESLAREVIESKKAIEANIGRPCSSIAWPWGTADAIDDVALAAIKAAGYTACFSAIRGAVGPGTDPFRIPRHGVEAHWPLSHNLAFANGFGERR